MAGRDDVEKGPRLTGVPGAPYRLFLEEAEMELDAIYVDKDTYSLWSALTGQHQGGEDEDAPALPGGAGNQAAVDRRQKRENALRSWLYAHCDDADIKRMIANTPRLVDADRRGGGRRAFLQIHADLSV